MAALGFRDFKENGAVQFPPQAVVYRRSDNFLVHGYAKTEDGLAVAQNQLTFQGMRQHKNWFQPAGFPTELSRDAGPEEIGSAVRDALSSAV